MIRLSHEDFVASIAQVASLDNERHISLRWYLPWLPRGPFQVYRRLRGEDNFHKATETTFSVDGSRVIELPWDLSPSPGYQRIASVKFRIAPSNDEPFMVRPLHHRTPLAEYGAGEGDSEIRFPGMTGLALYGSGIITITALTFIDDVVGPQVGSVPQWELIDTVGLPFRETPISGYDTRPLQGPGGNMIGLEAALERLYTGIGPLPPLWGALSPETILQAVWSDSQTGVQGLMESLLTDSVYDDSSYGRRLENAPYPLDNLEYRVGEGKGVSIASGENEIKIVEFLGMAVTTSSWMALTLGYGTTDKQADWEGDPLASYDYMVTTKLKNKDSGFIGKHWLSRLYRGDEVELAAIAAVSEEVPPTPSNLAISSERHRPIARDQPFRFSVTMNWDKPKLAPLPLSYGVTLNSSSRVMFLNSMLGDLMLPAVPTLDVDRTGVELERASFTSRTIGVDTGSNGLAETLRLAATDVHGRWSQVVELKHIFTPPPLQAPTLRRVAHTLTEVGPASIKAVFQIEVSWDWEDRSPKMIELSGSFDPDGVSTVAELQFFHGDPQQVPSVTENARVAPPDSNSETAIRTYEVTLDAVDVPFNSEPSRRYYVRVRAQENLRDEPCDWGEALSTTVVDPRPAAVPALDAKLYWTAAPDATGWAHFEFPLTADTNTQNLLGYVIYEATEQALWHATGGEPVAGSPNERADQLLAAHHDPNPGKADFRGVYSRKFPEPVSTSSTLQIMLPGNAAGLYIYRISSVTTANVESELSEPIFVSVPRRITPPAPMLSVQLEGLQATLELTCRAWEEVDHIDLYREQNDTLKTGDIGPIYKRIKTKPELPTRSVTFTSELPESWLAYDFCAIAVGPHDHDLGKLPGRSRYSNLVRVENVPRNAPTIENLQVARYDGDRFKVKFGVLGVLPFGSYHLKLETVSQQTLLPYRHILIAQTLEQIKEIPDSELSTNTFFQGIEPHTFEAIIEPNSEAVPGVVLVSITDQRGRPGTDEAELPLPEMYLEITDVRSGSMPHTSGEFAVEFDCSEPIRRTSKNNPKLKVDFSVLVYRHKHSWIPGLSIPSPSLQTFPAYARTEAKFDEIFLRSEKTPVVVETTITMKQGFPEEPISSFRTTVTLSRKDRDEHGRYGYSLAGIPGYDPALTIGEFYFTFGRPSVKLSVENGETVYDSHPFNLGNWLSSDDK